MSKKHVYSEHLFIWFYMEIFAKTKRFYFISGVSFNNAAETRFKNKFSQGRTSTIFLVSKKREPNAMMSCLMMTQLARVVFFVSGGAAAGVLQVRGAPGIMIPSRWKFTKQFHQTQLAVQLIVQASGCAVCCEAVNFFFMGKIDFIKKTLLNWAGNFFFMGKINFIKKTLLKWSYLRRFLHK